ncbi:MAG: helix-turn-helix domain-containing protein [Tenuifilaceae bacterium]|jgi:AraC-like DNA-binding protein|nr:helix-turn-helix domain-containing protein [Tenuifilaceae bacterium]
MAMKTARPASILEPYIKQYWGIENVLPKGEQYVHRIIPCGISELMFYLGERPLVLDSRKSFNENVVLNGHQKEFFDIQIANQISLFSIAFHPQGLMKFFNIPMNEAYNQSIPLKYIDRVLEKELFPRLQDAETFEQRAEIVNSHFTTLLEKNYANFEFQRVSHIVNTIKSSKGLIGVDSLSSEACLSRKQFERVFTKHIGSTPKQYLKTVRLQHSLHLKSKDKDKSLTQLAYDCGYYDQSHFINEFKQQTGHTPKQYFNNYDSFSDFFDG